MALAELETGLRDRLKAALGSRIREVVTLPDEWNDEFMADLLMRAPCVGIGFAGALPSVPGQFPAVLRTSWSVMAITAHAASHNAQRRGDALAIGAFQIIEACIAAVHGADIAHSTPLLTRVENFYDRATAKRALTVIAASFRADLCIQQPDELVDALNPFETFAADIDVAPANGVPEATVVVPLEQAA